MTIADWLRQRAADPDDADRIYLRFEDRTWTFAETHRAACRYGNLFRARLDPARPPHVGLLLENRPEFVFAELGAALAGAVIVGLNPTRPPPCSIRMDSPASSTRSPISRPSGCRRSCVSRRSSGARRQTRCSKRELQREAFLGVDGLDALWWRPRNAASYRRFGRGDLATLRSDFERASNAHRLPA